MSRVIMAIMGVTIGLTVATGAGAATGKWCFQWASDGAPYFDVFEDDGWGEDVDFANAYPARFGRVWIRKSSDKIWSNVLLNSSGCTGDWNIAPSTKYYFKQYTSARVNGQDIDVYVLANGEGWDSTTAAVHEFDATTPSSVPSTITLPPPPVVDQTRVMPVISRMLYIYATLDWQTDETLKVSFDALVNGCDNNGHFRVEDGLSQICYASGSHHKFGFAHEIGHMIGAAAGGPVPNTYAGSEGPFRDPVDGYDPPVGDGTHNCDEELMMGGPSGHSHDMTSREFQGAAQGDAFAQFIASATFNYVTDQEGVFVYGKGMMKWSNAVDGTHGGTLTWPPPASGDPWLEHPQPIDLSTGNGSGENVQWLVYECDPTANPVVGGFEHFGNEWDWTEFFWNLWTDQTSFFTIWEINDIWNATTERAQFCCNALDLDPGADEDLIPQSPCAPRNQPYDCRTLQNLPPQNFTVGKLWVADAAFDVSQGLLDTAEIIYDDPLGHPSTYDPDKYDLFYYRGEDTKVNY